MKKLSTAELTEAAILADVSVLLVIAGWFLPVSGALWAVSVVPFTALVVRHRFRAVAVAGFAGASIAFLALGPGLALQVLGASSAGFVVGTGIKRGWGWIRTVALPLSTVGVLGAAFVDAFLAIFASSRRLAFAQALAQWSGSKLFAREGLKTANRVVGLVHPRIWLALALLELLPILSATLLPRTTN